MGACNRAVARWNSTVVRLNCLMRKLLISTAFSLLACGCLTSFAFGQQPGRRFPITFEMDGRKVETGFTVRIKQKGKLTELKYSPNEPLVFPELAPNERFDLW